MMNAFLKCNHVLQKNCAKILQKSIHIFMQKKQSTIDLFFAPTIKGSSKIAKQKKVIDEENLIKNQENNPINVFLAPELISGSSSPHPISPENDSSSALSRALNRISDDEKDNVMVNCENPHPFHEKEIHHPSSSIMDTKNLQNPLYVKLTQEERIQLHWELEIIEHRIQFGKDEKYFHTASAPDILQSEKLNDVRPREMTRLKHYEEIKPVECIPDFWPQRCWDDGYIHLNHVQSEYLLQEIIEAPFKQRKISDKSNHSSGDTTSPSASSTDESSDDEVHEKKQQSQKSKIVTKPRVRSRVSQIYKESTNQIKPIPVRFSSLLFDTDEECNTDLEDF